uniref:LSDAT_euk domain-containing protein n=1 Tax=Loa loa TaxID=7209 RepID=A0A1I7V8K8_LOALO
MNLRFLFKYVKNKDINDELIKISGGTDEEGPSAHKKNMTEMKSPHLSDKVDVVFREEGDRIFGCLPNDDLVKIAKIPEMSEYANCMLDRRYRILHYRDGEITPKYLKKALELVSKTNFTNSQHRKSFAMNHWTPYQAILFGRGKPIKVIAGANYPYPVLIITSEKDHLEIDETFEHADDPCDHNEIKGSPMNGVFIPSNLLVYYGDSSFWSINLISVVEKHTDYMEILEYLEDKVKFVIVISNGIENTRESAISEALTATKEIRKEVVSAPICVVAQPDNRRDVTRNNRSKGNSTVLMFAGSDVNASTLLVDKNDTSEILKTRFTKWKEELLFLNSYEVIAFHFTVVNGTEPKDSEEIFSDIFPDIPLSTLRLFDESSTTGVDYQVVRNLIFMPVPCMQLL